MNKKVDFDEYSSDYIELMNKQHSKYGDISYYSEQKADITHIIVNHKIKKILEFGCGIGRNLPFLKEKFPTATLYASDISEQSLARAKLENKNVEFIANEDLDTFVEQFDLIFIAGVYHHIEPKLRSEVTQRINKLLKANATLICFEHNPYNPLTRHMVNTCEFDEDAVLLKKTELIEIFKDKGFHSFNNGYILFVPPKLKKINFIEKYLKFLPLGGQYYVSCKK